ncbi:MAG: PfkB family carbohydrate kinase, partial [Alkalispirochaetaceae bacterium]
EEELRPVFTEIASIADILVGNEEDFQLALLLPGPPAGGEGLAGKMESFKSMIATVRTAFPEVAVCATTLREVVSANRHLWGALVSAPDGWHVAEPREITVLDRIGGGDGFVGGLLYAILKGWEPQQWVEFAWASGALATTFLTDYAQPADEEQIWSIWSGNARVKR